jgi:hypothetical protein
MAETDFGRLGPGGLDQIGSPADTRADRFQNIRDDGHSYFPLHIQGSGELPPAPEPLYVAPSPPLSEGELRQRLAECLQATQAAQQALEAAQAACGRAKAHRHDCEVELHRFDDLEQEIADATLTALRGPEGKPNTSAFAGRIADRTLAEAALLAASTAEVELAHEHYAAGEKHKLAAQKERSTLHALLLVARDALKPELRRLEKQLDAFSQAYRRGDDAAPWASVAQALRDDPMGASLGVEIPDAPEPMAPVPLTGAFALVPATIKDARPVDAGDDWSDEAMPAAEYHQREGRRRQAEMAMTEAAALEAARKGVGR